MDERLRLTHFSLSLVSLYLWKILPYCDSRMWVTLLVLASLNRSLLVDFVSLNVEKFMQVLPIEEGKTNCL